MSLWGLCADCVLALTCESVHIHCIHWYTGKSLASTLSLQGDTCLEQLGVFGGMQCEQTRYADTRSWPTLALPEILDYLSTIRSVGFNSPLGRAAEKRLWRSPVCWWRRWQWRLAARMVFCLCFSPGQGDTSVLYVEMTVRKMCVTPNEKA